MMTETTAQAKNFLLPGDNTFRLNKLYDYEILDTHPEDTFDRIALLAAQVFETPNAFITFVDRDRVFFKSNISNFAADDIPVEKTPFSLATIKEDFTVYYDTFDDHFLRNSPLVNCAGGIRFYAVAPLITPEGYLVGTVCVADSIPRNHTITPKQVEMLKSLADIIVNTLESRLRYNNLLKAQDELMDITLHEIKNPLATISLANDVLRKDPVKTPKMSTMISQSVARIHSKLHDFLTQSELEEKQLKLSIENIELSGLFDSLLKDFELQAIRKNQSIILQYEDKLPKVAIDVKKICVVLHNLLSNAIKYSYHNSEIVINARKKDDCVEIEFRDYGQGLSSEDISKLFLKFAKLSAIPTGKETSTGLGLFICKSLVEMHNGKIYATSDGKNCGCSFFITLPLDHKLDNEPDVTYL